MSESCCTFVSIRSLNLDSAEVKQEELGSVSLISMVVLLMDFAGNLSKPFAGDLFWLSEIMSAILTLGLGISVDFPVP